MCHRAQDSVVTSKLTRLVVEKTLATRGIAVMTCHLHVDAGFINKHQVFDIEFQQRQQKRDGQLFDALFPRFVCSEFLFFSVIPRRASALDILGWFSSNSNSSFNAWANIS